MISRYAGYTNPRNEGEVQIGPTLRFFVVVQSVVVVVFCMFGFLLCAGPDSLSTQKAAVNSDLCTRICTPPIDSFRRPPAPLAECGLYSDDMSHVRRRQRDGKRIHMFEKCSPHSIVMTIIHHGQPTHSADRSANSSAPFVRLSTQCGLPAFAVGRYYTPWSGGLAASSSSSSSAYMCYFMADHQCDADAARVPKECIKWAQRRSALLGGRKTLPECNGRREEVRSCDSDIACVRVHRMCQML